jgi:hypothetical protein
MIWKLAGICGVNPSGFSYRELEIMSDAKRSHDWDLFAPLLCYVANPNISSRHKKLTVDKIHPYRKKKKLPMMSKDEARRLFKRERERLNKQKTICPSLQREKIRKENSQRKQQ